MIRLGVNIDHVATLRQARRTHYPQPVMAALLAEQAGADNITMHLREDRRHIQDRDLRLVKEAVHIPLNFEMAPTDEMVEIALALKPAWVCLVPEKRAELTTEGGLVIKGKEKFLGDRIELFHKAGILVSLFIDETSSSIEAAAALGVKAVELHTGDLIHRLESAVLNADKLKVLQPFQAAVSRVHELGMQVHVGHGINYQTAPWIRHLPHVEEANIGHAIVAESLWVGLPEAVRRMKQLLNEN